MQEYLPDNKESITSQAKYCDVLESCLNLNDKMTLLLDFCNFNDNNLEVVMYLSTCLSLAESAIIAISSGSGSFINDKSNENRLQSLLCAYTRIDMYPFQKNEAKHF